MRRLTGILGLFALLLAPAMATAATISIVNMDGANEGFNDPTAAAPVGGNPGTTVGQQRQLAFQFAADIWGSVLPSAVEIRIQAAFNPLTCTPTSAVLGSAGTIQIFANSPGVEYNSVWYHVALANRLAGVDLAPGAPGTIADDIVAQFNSNLNGNPACLGGRGWYYGLDTNHGTNIDLVAVLLHEFGHGLGFANFINEATGFKISGLGDIYSQYTLDDTTGKKWNQMTTAEIVASGVNFRRVSWDGIHVTGAVPAVLSPGMPILRINSPVAGTIPVGTAAFGPAISSPGITADIVQALDPADGAGPTTTDGCSPLTNAAAVAGKIALIDRGTCGFVVKVKNAQNAGAVAAIIGNTTAAQGSAPGLGGADPTITIPSVGIGDADNTALKAQVAGSTVNGTVGLDLAIRAGANTAGRALLFMPKPVQGGSSGSHWDQSTFRNQLMEPAINADLTHSVDVPEDLTTSEMIDIGWFSDGDGVPDGVDSCLGSDPSATVVINGCDSGVPNLVFTNGCRISDGIEDCFAQYAGGNSGPGSVSSCVSHFTNDLKKQGILTGNQHGQIQSCVKGGH